MEILLAGSHGGIGGAEVAWIFAIAPVITHFPGRASLSVANVRDSGRGMAMQEQTAEVGLLPGNVGGTMGWLGRGRGLEYTSDTQERASELADRGGPLSPGYTLH